VACFERYVERFSLPIQYQRQATSIEYDLEEKIYRVDTGQATLEASNVVVATGLYQTPKIPAYAAKISPSILQLHSGKYRNPGALPPGAVLVIGSGQSGGQIAEELYQAGRKVYLCTGNAGGAPRRYRGKDIYEWVLLNGFLDRTADLLPSPQARFASNPQLSGKNGGHALNLHQFYRDGVTLLGRIQGADQGKIWLTPDLKENLAKGDRFEADIVKMVDDFVSQSGMEAPEETLPVLRDGYEAQEIREIQLAEAGISTVIWATGYNFDFSLVKLPIFDEYGYPIQKRGITAYPGLYFIGLPWLYRRKSGLLVGFGEDAEFIVNYIVVQSKNV
jgi:putative flavoprotein involved in K+ transport